MRKMGLEVQNDVRTLEKKGVLAPRLKLGTIWEQVSSSFFQQIGSYRFLIFTIFLKIFIKTPFIKDNNFITFAIFHMKCCNRKHYPLP